MVQVMLGVDRLDMIKGIPQKLLAFEKFLEEHPQWRDKVLLVQIAVPSRTDVPEYQVTSCLLLAQLQGLTILTSNASSENWKRPMSIWLDLSSMLQQNG